VASGSCSGEVVAAGLQTRSFSRGHKLAARHRATGSRPRKGTGLKTRRYEAHKLCKAQRLEAELRGDLQAARAAAAEDRIADAHIACGGQTESSAANPER
jgi:hypothetical protein